MRGKTATSLALSCNQASLQWKYWFAINSCFGQGIPRKIPKQPKLLIKQKDALLKLTARPHFWEQHPHNFLNMENYWAYAYIEPLS